VGFCAASRNNLPNDNLRFERSTVPRDNQRRLHFLDGLRGFACLYVLLFHECTSKLVATDKLSPTVKAISRWFNFGHFSVVFFIVLSGFSLMLPIARSRKLELVGGLRVFVARRARRILPPYYAALLLSAAVLALSNWVSSRFGVGQRIEGALGAGPVLSHLLLIHNLKFEWAYRINAPMWSVATEWQIYAIFAVVLLPLCRLIGAVATTCVAWVGGSLPFFLLPNGHNLYWACPWFVGSFALGMTGALLSSGDGSSTRRAIPWGRLGLVTFAVLLVLIYLGLVDTWPMPVTDLVASAMAFCVINHCAESIARSSTDSSNRREPSILVSFLESRSLVYLGGFSYSLYLVQHPLLRFVEKGLERLHATADMNLIMEVLVATPLVTALAWVFSELFERPFTSGGVLLPALRRRPSPEP
jgi:peptidoglycan/LPS O-acetylase OafA/YrhL